MRRAQARGRDRAWTSESILRCCAVHDVVDVAGDVQNADEVHDVAERALGAAGGLDRPREKVVVSNLRTRRLWRRGSCGTLRGDLARWRRRSVRSGGRCKS